MTKSPPKKGEDLIRKEDFRSFEIDVSIKNLTTKTEVRDGKRFYGKTLAEHDNPDLYIHFVEIGEKNIILDVPPKTCTRGHNVIVTLKVNAHERGKVTFSASAKVRKSEKFKDTGRERVDLELIQFDSESWHKLQELFGQRQQEIEDFFEAVKGF